MKKLEEQITELEPFLRAITYQPRRNGYTTGLIAAAEKTNGAIVTHFPQYLRKITRAKAILPSESLKLMGLSCPIYIDREILSDLATIIFSQQARIENLQDKCDIPMSNIDRNIDDILDLKEQLKIKDETLGRMKIYIERRPDGDSLEDNIRFKNLALEINEALNNTSEKIK